MDNQHVKRTRQQTICRNNLRQLGLALSGYSADWGAYPLWNTDGSPDGMPSANYWWNEALERYSGAVWETNLIVGKATPKSRLYLCPSYARVCRPGTIFEELQRTGLGATWALGHQIGSYGYNAYGTGSMTNSLGIGGTSKGPQILENGVMVTISFRPTRESEVIAPATMFALGDAQLFGSATWIWGLHGGTAVLQRKRIYGGCNGAKACWEMEHVSCRWACRDGSHQRSAKQGQRECADFL